MLAFALIGMPIDSGAPVIDHEGFLIGFHSGGLHHEDEGGKYSQGRQVGACSSLYVECQCCIIATGTPGNALLVPPVPHQYAYSGASSK